MKLQSILQRHWLLLCIFFLAVALRLYSLQGNSVMFWYDQARDFVVVQKMIDERDIKIQGPSASGTNDTLYHGVFYYYLILPALVIGKGSPLVVTQFLAVFGSLGVVVIYVLALTIFKSRSVATVSALLLAVSFLHVHQSTWLSNPQILGVFVGLYYLFVWKTLYEKPRPTNFVLLGLSLGLCVQGGIFELYLLGVLIGAYVLRVFQQKRLVVISPKLLLLSLGSFLLTVSTMILTQLLLVYRNVLTPQSLESIGRSTANSITVVFDILELYLQSLHMAISPNAVLAVLVLLLIPLIVGIKQTNSNQREWLLLLLTAPLWLLLVQYRNATHLFIGFEVIFYLLFSVGLVMICRQVYRGKAVASVLLGVFVITNIVALSTWQTSRNHLYGLQKGALLSEQLALIDATYELADGQDFTISASTNPYGIAVTWSYVYNWYGKNKYGYLPHFLGNSQAGYAWQGILPETATALPQHFTIIEPDTGLGPAYFERFIQEQDRLAGPIAEQQEFGSLELQMRKPISPLAFY